MRHDPGLAASPPVLGILIVGESEILSFFGWALWTDRPFASGGPAASQADYAARAQICSSAVY